MLNNTRARSRSLCVLTASTRVEQHTGAFSLRPYGQVNMSALEEAEAFVASLESAPCPLLTLAAMQKRFLETLEAREEAVQTLERKRRQFQASLQSVKLVSARMIQCVRLTCAPAGAAHANFLKRRLLPTSHAFFPQGEGGLYPQPLERQRKCTPMNSSLNILHT